MKAFRGPIEGFAEDEDDEIDDDDEIVPVIGHDPGLFQIDSDDEDIPIHAIYNAVAEGVLNEIEDDEDDDDNSLDDFIVDDGNDPDYNAEAEEDTDEDEDLVNEPNVENEGGDQSDEPSVAEDSADEESLPDIDEEHEHVHDFNCSGGNLDLAPSPLGPEVEVGGDLASSPEIMVRRVPGELDIAGRLRQEAEAFSPALEHQGLRQNGLAHTLSSSDDDLSELSGPEDQDMLKVNGSETPNEHSQEDEEEEEDGVDEDTSPSVVQSTTETTQDVEESPRVYSNPMITDEEQVGERVQHGDDDEANSEGNNDHQHDEKMLQLRGDCIGSTTYSERHVLKILIKWMKEIELMKQQQEAEKIDLDTDFDNELSLLWDMSSEKDVALYLEEKDIFFLLRESLNITECDRLVEITIGILANLLSVREILDTFKIIEETLQFLPRVLSELILCQRIPRLIQSLAVVRRLVWYMSNVEFIESWMKAFTEIELMQAVNFLLKSCRNIGILSEMVTVLFVLLETIRDHHKSLQKNDKSIGLGVPQNDKPEEEEEEESSSEDEEIEVSDDEGAHKNKKRKKNDDCTDILEFCKLGLVTSLCESFQELLKYPVIDPGLWPNSVIEKKDDDDANEDDLLRIPPNAIQESICLGLNTFELIHKVKPCREYLYIEAGTIIKIYTEFYHRFHLYTQHVSNEAALHHFGEGLKLIGYYHAKRSSNLPQAIIIQPLSAALKFKNQEEKLKQEQEKDEENENLVVADGGEKNGIKNNIITNGKLADRNDLILSITLMIHTYFEQLGNKFGLDKIHQIVLNEKNDKLSRFLEYVNVAVGSWTKYVSAKIAGVVNEYESDSEDEKKNAENDEVVGPLLPVSK